MIPRNNVEDLRELLDVAAGRKKAGLYLEGGTMVNVLSGEIYPANIAVHRDRIAYVGPGRKMVGPDTAVIDASGCYLCPGLVEPHFHPWVLYNPATLAEAALSRGITTMACDSLFFFINLGVKGFLKLIEVLNNMPLRFYWMARVLHQTPDPREDEIFSLANLRELFAHPLVIKIAEITRWPLLYKADLSLLDKICLAGACGVGLEGHTAGCSYEQLNVLAASGTESCHEATTASEAAQRLRLGFWTMLRHNSLRPDLPELLRAVTEMRLSTGRLLFTSDGAGPDFIEEAGLLDGMLRLAVKAGVDPVTALQMATINPATYLGLEKEAGSLSPGRRADILLLPDLENFAPRLVLAGGRVAAAEGKPVSNRAAPDWAAAGFTAGFPPHDLLSDPGLYGIPAAKPEVFPVIDLVSTVITRRQDRLLAARGGFLERDEDLLHCTLIDRSGRWLTNGFISGAGQVEAFATSFNASYNLLVLGRDRSAMALAAARVAEMQGGMVLVEGGRVGYRLPLELGGMMSGSPFAVVAREAKRLEEMARDFGYRYNTFLYSTLFLVCDFLPELRITASGLKDVKKGQVLRPSRPLRSF